MRAFALEKTGPPEVLKLSTVPIPSVKPGWVLVKIHGFGLNRSELILRAHEADEEYIKLPRIPGIECAGEVADPSDSGLKIGQRVVALMGGMGRSFDGSYAEYALLPQSNVFAVTSTLPWAELAAIPETWFTAWGSLVECLDLQKDQKLLVRGGTSALGLAAIQIGKSFGCFVAASTRDASKQPLLERAGADLVLIDDGTLSKQEKSVNLSGFDAILELIGPSTLADSMALANKHGKVCVTGILGPEHVIHDFDPIKDIPNGVALMGFYSNYPNQETIDAIFAHIETHGLQPIIGARFSLEEMREAHTLMERNAAQGKVVITVD
ncbi:MAG: zinc-binding dehydrogenase [Actinobacteria bacterium]|nr:zinc-binding dehydrogenase [Actinomycetota bacterium]